jgi:hypothetical protein
MDIQLGYWRWKIYRWNEHPNPFKGRTDLALEWLRRFQSDRLVMSELHALLGGNALRWSEDHQVLEEIAARLSSGEFQVCAQSGHPFPLAVADVYPAEAESAPLQQKTQAPPPAQPSPQEPPPDPTLPPAADAAVIAQTLKNASERGTAFCEVCAKQQASSAPLTPAILPPTPLPPSTFPPSVDADAVVAGLKTGSDDGVPFCEICEKARLNLAGAAKN